MGKHFVKKIALYGAFLLAICVAFVVGCAVYLQYFFDIKQHKPVLEAHISQLSHLDTSIEDVAVDVEFRYLLLPRIQLEVEGLSLQTPKSFGQDRVADISNISLGVSFFSILKSKLELESLIVSDALLQLDERANLDYLRKAFPKNAAYQKDKDSSVLKQHSDTGQQATTGRHEASQKQPQENPASPDEAESSLPIELLIDKIQLVNIKIDYQTTEARAIKLHLEQLLLKDFSFAAWAKLDFSSSILLDELETSLVFQSNLRVSEDLQRIEFENIQASNLVSLTSLADDFAALEPDFTNQLALNKLSLKSLRFLELADLQLETTALKRQQTQFLLERLELDTKDKKAALESGLKLKSGASKLELEQLTYNPTTNPQISSQNISASIALREVLALLSIDYTPAEQQALQDLRIQIDELIHSQNQLSLKNLALGLDTTEFVGSLLASLKSKPSFSLFLKGDSLNLDGYLMPESEEEATTKDNKQEDTNHTARQIIPKELLQSFDMNLSLSMESLVYKKVLNFEETHLELRLENGDATLQEFSSKLEDGDLSLKGTINTSQSQEPPITSILLKANSLPAQKLLQGFLGLDFISGDLNTRANLLAKGSSLKAIRGSLSGNFDADVQAIQLQGVDLQHYACDISTRVLGQKYSGSNTGVTHLKDLRFRARLNDAKAKTSLQTSPELAPISAIGTLSLSSLDFQQRISFGQSAKNGELCGQGLQLLQQDFALLCEGNIEDTNKQRWCRPDVSKILDPQLQKLQNEADAALTEKKQQAQKSLTKEQEKARKKIEQEQQRLQQQAQEEEQRAKKKLEEEAKKAAQEELKKLL